MFSSSCFGGIVSDPEDCRIGGRHSPESCFVDMDDMLSAKMLNRISFFNLAHHVESTAVVSRRSKGQDDFEGQSIADQGSSSSSIARVNAQLELGTKPNWTSSNASGEDMLSGRDVRFLVPIAGGVLLGSLIRSGLTG